MVLRFFVTLLFFTLLLTDFGRIGGAAVAPAATSLHGRKAQVSFPGTPGTNGGGWVWQGCGPSQCYNQEYGQCFHSTSVECRNPTKLEVVTPSPTPRPVVQRIETENPILFRLNNIADDYILSASDRATILSNIRTLIDDTLDESWELISVKHPGEYIGTRRLQSSLRGENKRRLNKTIYIPVIITVRGREDMSHMARLFILQALRNKLNLLLMYLKSLNANAFASVQISVEELNLADIGTLIVTSQPTLQPTNSPLQSTIDVTLTGTPSWVWIIVAAVCTVVGICLLCCICRAGYCLSCEGCGCCLERKRDTKNDYEMQTQLAKRIYLAGVPRNGNSDGGRWDVYGRRRQSDRVRRHGDRRRSALDWGRRHGDRRRSDRKRRRSDGHVLNGNSNGYHQSDRRRPSRPVAKRSLSMIEKEHAREEIDIVEEGMKVETEHNDPVLAAPPAYPAATLYQGHDPVAYQNALVVYDDVQKTRFTLEPEGSMIDDIANPETTALVLYNPPKEPEGILAEATALVLFNPPKEPKSPPKDPKSRLARTRTPRRRSLPSVTSEESAITVDFNDSCPDLRKLMRDELLDC
jgi:hypothetical protein